MNVHTLLFKRLKRAALFFLLLTMAGTTQSLAQSTVGNDFWVTFLSNHDGNNSISLIAAGSTPCTGTVTNPYTNWSTEFEVTVGTTTIVEIPLSEAYAQDASDCVLNTALHVVTTDSISLYASNFKAYTFDVTDVLPTPSLGSNYIIQTYPGIEGRNAAVTPSANSRNLATSSSEFTVVAVEDNTTVYFYLTGNTLNGHYAYQPFSVTLNAGQCYQVMSEYDGNLTGSQISVSGNKNVAVFAGNSCANVPTTCPYCDHIVEQMMPVSSWGNHFVVTNSAMRNYDEVRVTAANNGCQILINGSLVTTINQRETYQFEITDADPSLYLETSEPATVYLYYAGSECAGTYGDPSMVMISPIEQRMNYVTFSTFNSGASQYHFVNVVTNTDDVSNMYLDGNNVASEFQTVSGNEGYSFARIAIEHGSHTLMTTGAGFVGHVYGLGDDESYAFSVGSNAVQDLYTSMLINGQYVSGNISDISICTDTVNFDLNLNYNLSQVNWTFGDGETATGIPVTHIYPGLGDYPVSCDVYKLDGNGNDSLVASLSTVLHIYESFYTEFEETALDSYTWEWMGETYFESGDYVYEGQTLFGCDSIVTLHLTITHEITVAANPEEGGTVTGAGIYERNSTCTLSATANEGYMFTYWTDETGRIVSAEANYTFVVTESRSLVAYFAEEGSLCDITFDLYDSYGDSWNGNYLVVSLEGGPYLEITVPEGSYAYYTLPVVDGSTVTLGWITGSWIGECSFTLSYSNGNRIYYGHNMYGGFSYSFVMDCEGMPASVFDITAEANPWDFGTVSGAGTYNQFEICTLTASPYEGYHFLNWTLEGEEISTDNIYSFEVTESKNFVSNFELNSYDITVTANPAEGGTVVGGGIYNHFETCILTATANEGYVFLNWTDETGLVVATDPEYSFTVTGERVFMAKFAEESTLCDITFDLYDSYGDGWNGNCLVVNYADGTFQQITLPSSSYASYIIPFVDGSPVMLSWIVGSWIGECSFAVSYSNGNRICYGQNLSSGFSYDFDVDCGGMPVSSFDITVWINPEEGGTATGAGFYNYGETCTLTANDNWGYHFLNWTKDGEEVSTMREYSFVVTEGGDYVANFGEGGYFIEATANPTEGGVIEGVGEYYYGDYCWLEAYANEGYSFMYWTENGEVISTDAYYDFYVVESRNLVANFTLPLTIEATANPAESGIIYGAGDYYYGETCWLEAYANEGYVFLNWTEDGEVVSADAYYSFTVTESHSLVANFMEGVVVYDGDATNGYVPVYGFYTDAYLKSETVYPLEELTALSGGTISGMRFFASQSYVSWGNAYFQVFLKEVEDTYINGFSGTDDATIVYEGPLSIVDGVMNVVFDTSYSYNGGNLLVGVYNMVQGSYVSSTWYGTNVEGASVQGYSYNGLDAINPTQRNFIPKTMFFYSSGSVPTYSITVTANPADGGTVTGGGVYESGQVCTLNATANEGYTFINWTKDGTTVSTNPTYSFFVTQSATYTANFTQYQGDVTQVSDLGQGWNWWSTYVEQDGMDGFSMLEESFGQNGLMIKSQNSGYASYLSGYGWYGSLNGLNNEESYRLNTSAACSVSMTGELANPANHPITINSGWTWIGFPWNESIGVEYALGDFMPETNDVIKGRFAYTMYYNENGSNLWFGSLNAFEPGQGYMYFSNSDEAKTLTFEVGRGQTSVPNVTGMDNIFRPSASRFADNMTLTAVVDMDGTELRSEDFEVDVFVGNECRGSAKLMYVAPIDRYVAFLTVFGNEDDELAFSLTDGTMTALSDNALRFASDGHLGTLTNPVVLHFGILGIDDNAQARVMVYPNPSNGVFNIEGQGIKRIDVFNAYGQVVLTEETVKETLQIDLGDKAAGVYLLRVVTENGVLNQQLIKE